MSSRIHAAAVAAAILLASSMGCRAVRCGDSCGTTCSDACGNQCGKGRWPAFAKYDCSCDNACGGACAGQCQCRCKGDPTARRPVLGRLCGCTGCGELYWNAWFNDPPRLCDPCDRCGNYAGQCCGHCSAAPPALPAVEAVDAANEEVSSGETEEHAAASKVDAVE